MIARLVRWAAVFGALAYTTAASAAATAAAAVPTDSAAAGALDRAFGELGGAGGEPLSLSLQLLLVMGLLTILPALLLMMTSFTRIIVVLAILRQALGLQQSPPNQVLIGISLFLSLFIMAPTLDRVNTAAIEPYSAGQINAEVAIERAGDQFHGFMIRQTREYDLKMFADIADAFLEFIGDAKLVIHNASFDVPFLNAELGWCKRRQIPMDQSIDTLLIARKKFSGAGNSLDALCRRFGIDNSHRTLHGALLDSEILAEVYLELIGGRQPDLVLGGGGSQTSDTTQNEDWRPRPRPEALPSRITEDERAAHQAFVEKLGASALWSKLA